MVIKMNKVNVFTVESLLGTVVTHRQGDVERSGEVVSVDEDRLPLIGVDLGCEFLSYVPYIDLYIKDAN